MRFFPRDTGERPFGSESPENAGRFPVLHGKNDMSQGVENQGSQISVPWALRVMFLNSTVNHIRVMMAN